MKQESLHQIMNKMVQRLDMIQPESQEEYVPKALTELEAFTQMDSLLASLNKEFLDAKGQRKELVRLNGADDAMSEIALDMEDSAWCAMQTRYIELRQRGKMMARAQSMMRQSEINEKEHIAEELKRDKEEALKQFTYFAQLLERIKEMNKNKASDVIAWMIFMLLISTEDIRLNKQNFAQAVAV